MTPNEIIREAAATQAHCGISVIDEIATRVAPAVIKACKSDTCDDDETIDQMLARKIYALADSMVLESRARLDLATQDAEEAITSAIWTPRATKILAEAASIAMETNSSYIGTEHILAAMIGPMKGISGLILSRHGLTLEHIAEECNWPNKKETP